MVNKFTLVFLITCSNLVYGQVVNKNDLTIGDEYSITSESLNSKINIFVGLPENYHLSNCRYPVHYVLDGQIIFSYYYGVTDILTHGEIPECIVVGIQSVNRGYYFKPGNGANEFTNFLSNELIPFINRNYRTKNFKLICGHSTSGAFILNTLLNSPELFDIYIAGAPYHSNMFMNTNIDSLLSFINSRKYLYVFYGIEDNKKEKSDWDSLSLVIKNLKSDKLGLNNKEYEKEGHYSIIYRYVPDGLKEAFKDWNYTPGSEENFSFSDFKKYAAIQQQKFNISFDYAEGYYIDNGMKLSQKGESESAIKLLDYGLTYYPNSLLLHNIIAVAYEKSGSIESAKEHYSKMLEIDPNLDFVKTRLNELK